MHASIILCVHICVWFKGRQLERESLSTWQKDLVKYSHCSLFLSCCMSPMSHFWNKCIIMFYAFFQCGIILKLSQIIKYKWDVNYLSKHNKTSCNMKFCFECVSKGSLWRLVRGEVSVVCLLSELLERIEEWQSPGREPNQTFQSLPCRDWPLNSASQVLYPAVTLTGADLCNYNPYFLMYWYCVCFFFFLLLFFHAVEWNINPALTSFNTRPYTPHSHPQPFSYT